MSEITRVVDALRRVDQAESGEPICVDVVRCRREATRRQAVRRTVTAASTVLVLLVGCWLAFRGSDSPLIVNEASPITRATQPIGRLSPDLTESTGGGDSRLATALAHARHQADAIERTLELHFARQRREALQQRLAELQAEPVVLDQLRLQEGINLTAAIMLDYADRLASEAGEPLLAASEYRQVKDLYPGTPWAVEAEKALVRLP